MKLNLGCGDMLLGGFTNIDLYNPKADVRCDVKSLPFEDESVELIYSSHVIEHFHFFEIWDVLLEWKRVLKKGGILEIETPDLLASCKRFVEASEQERIGLLYAHFFSCPWEDGQWHKFLFTESQLRWTLDKLGFKNIERRPALRYIGRENICLKMVAQK
ncbi:MAG: methyltransferase domain-containing protein [Gallionella sp.]|jgi:ubiquinone/menaquinone biosynthesis C-methylase UbiE